MIPPEQESDSGWGFACHNGTNDCDQTNVKRRNKSALGCSCIDKSPRLKNISSRKEKSQNQTLSKALICDLEAELLSQGIRTKRAIEKQAHYKIPGIDPPVCSSVPERSIPRILLRVIDLRMPSTLTLHLTWKRPLRGLLIRCAEYPAMTIPAISTPIMEKRIMLSVSSLLRFSRLEWGN